MSVLERVNNFLNDVREELRHSMVKDSAIIKNDGLAVRKNEEGTDEKIIASQDFQKKVIPHWESEQAPSSKRIPNLAGLTRMCEIFRAGGLAVGDMGVVQDKLFRLIDVTAEKWVPMVEVPAENVRAFLQRKRAEGYTVVGLEHTANSVTLDEFAFPAKTVVVLGREKEGIPVDIIQEAVDVCVEIPQLGIVRSLNVRVSAAIAIWDYTCQ